MVSSDSIFVSSMSCSHVDFISVLNQYTFGSVVSCLSVCVPLCAIAMISRIACSLSVSWCCGGGRGSAARARIWRTTSRGGAPSGVGRAESPS